MNHTKDTRFSEEDYLALERASREKHAFIDGRILGMAGASLRHNLIATNIARALGNRLADKPCIVLNSDQRVNVAATRNYLYPDVTILCGPPEYGLKDRMAIQNPKVVFEVLSTSTEDRDFGEKWALFRATPSLTHFVAVRQDERRAYVFARTDVGRWDSREVAGDGTIDFESLGITLPLDDIYAKVDSIPVEE